MEGSHSRTHTGKLYTERPQDRKSSWRPSCHEVLTSHHHISHHVNHWPRRTESRLSWSRCNGIRWGSNMMTLSLWPSGAFCVTASLVVCNLHPTAISHDCYPARFISPAIALKQLWRLFFNIYFNCLKTAEWLNKQRYSVGRGEKALLFCSHSVIIWLMFLNRLLDRLHLSLIPKSTTDPVWPGDLALP